MKIPFKIVPAALALGAVIASSSARAKAQDSAGKITPAPMADENVPQAPNDIQKKGSNFNAGLIENWPEKPRAAAKLLIDKYGPPDEATSKMLVWRNNAPWKRTIVYNEEISHNFPVKHTDFLEQTVDYKVPVAKAGDLAKFDGSVIVDRTKGELSARCDKEENNRLALNLADEVARGIRTTADARQFFTKTIEMSMSGKSSPYLDELRFTPQSSDQTVDPDTSTVK